MRRAPALKPTAAVGLLGRTVEQERARSGVLPLQLEGLSRGVGIAEGLDPDAELVAPEVGQVSPGRLRCLLAENS